MKLSQTSASTVVEGKNYSKLNIYLTVLMNTLIGGFIFIILTIKGREK